ncbi:MAG: pilus assembly protein TadG-related protein [Nitrospinota bacterium]
MAPLTGMLLVALFGMAALAIDLGWLSVVDGELQNAADAGALAGVVELVTTGEDPAEAMAVTYTTQPDHFLLTNPAPGADAVIVTVLGPETLQVRVSRSAETGAGAVTLIFARVLGIETMQVEAVAVATMNRQIIGTGPGNLLPFGIHENMLDEDNDGNYDIGRSIDIYPHDRSAGNFGLLDLNGVENSNDDTDYWIENGYDDIFIIPESQGYLNVEGDTGISGGSLNGAIRSRLGDRVLLPVFDQVTGEGADTIFRVMGFVGVIITSSQLTGPEESRNLIINVGQFSAQNLIVGGASTPTNNTVSTPVLIQ